MRESVKGQLNLDLRDDSTTSRERGPVEEASHFALVLRAYYLTAVGNLLKGKEEVPAKRRRQTGGGA